MRGLHRAGIHRHIQDAGRLNCARAGKRVAANKTPKAGGFVEQVGPQLFLFGDGRRVGDAKMVVGFIVRTRFADQRSFQQIVLMVGQGSMTVGRMVERDFQMLRPVVEADLMVAAQIEGSEGKGHHDGQFGAEQGGQRYPAEAGAGAKRKSSPPPMAWSA